MLPPSSDPSSGDTAGPTHPGRRLVLIAGAGRSGTSTLAGILKQLGLHVPQPELAPDESNPRGFGEAEWVVDLHTELLTRAEVHPADARPQAWVKTGRIAGRRPVQARAHRWLEPHFAVADELVVKDPRVSWFLDLWRAAAARSGATPCFATMLRSPTEVVGSRRKYYGKGLGPTHSVAGWVNMLLHTELLTRDSARVFIRYDDLLADWTKPVFTAAEHLNLRSVSEAGEDAVREVHDFIDPGLRRVHLTWDDIEVPTALRDLTEEAWKRLLELVEPEGDTPQVRLALDGLRESYDSMYSEAEALTRSSIHAARIFGGPRGAADGPQRKGPAGERPTAGQSDPGAESQLAAGRGRRAARRARRMAGRRGRSRPED